MTLDVGALIDVGVEADNGIDSGPALGGSVTFSTAQTSFSARTGSTPGTSATGVNLSVNGGSLKDFISGVTGKPSGIKGESAWDGVVVVGNQVYSYNDATLYLTPTITIAPSGG